jgi:poly(hydroxyalkanoate) depolymerase family esterase
MKINEDFIAQMQKAAQLLQTEGPMAATAAVQRALHGAAPEGATSPFAHQAAAETMVNINPAFTGTAKAQAASPRKVFANLAQRLRAGMDRPVVEDVATDSADPLKGKFLSLSCTAPAGTRAYKLYIPSTYAGEPAPLVVMLHGCTQTAASFAAGSLMNRTADRHGFLVAYPEQSTEENQGRCWNWFSPSHQARGGGEPASIAGAVGAVAEAEDRWTVDPARVFVAGMSAGGAMAAAVAATYPDVFAAVAIHSGLAYGSARTLPAAMQAMRRGGPDPEAQGDAAFAAMNAAARVVPALVIHGTADAVVDPVNAEHAVRQWMATNRRAARGAYEPELDRPDATVRDDGAGALPFTRRTWLDAGGRIVQELIEVEGLGHAWSGGAAGGSYTDPRGPSASDEIHDFFARVSA